METIEFLINLSKEEWMYFDKEHSSIRKEKKRTRKTFLEAFHDKLSNKLQSNYKIDCDNPFVCFLSNTSNWFNPSNFPVWHGSYKCCLNTCPARYTADVVELDCENIEIKFKQLIKPSHDFFVEKKMKCSGAKRESMALRVSADGISNVRDQNIISNLETGAKEKPESSNVLAVIKYERKHQYRISTNHLIDCEAAKNCFDYSLKSENPRGLSGFLQEINHIPFGIIFLCQLQMELWLSIKKKYPIWFFDATGNVLKRINGQNSPLLYSLVCHDKEKKLILPVADFITTCQTIQSITKHLTSIKFYVEQHGESVAPIIVTDNSWALIGAVMNTFNNNDTAKYLHWAYDLLFAKTNELRNQLSKVMKCRLIICSTHYLKNFIRDVQGIKVETNVRKSIIFCFTLLQDAVDLQKFDDYLKHIYNLYNSEYFDDHVEYSIKFLRTEIANRSLNRTNVNERTKDKEEVEKETVSDYISITNNNNIYFNPEIEENLKSASPFVNYYTQLFDQLKIEVDQRPNGVIKNRFYSKELFALIKKRLYLLPMWSSILVEQIKESHFFSNFGSRLSNNPVENWFGHLKNHILQNSSYSCSELLCKLHPSIKAKHTTYFTNSENSNKPEKKNKFVLKENWRKYKLNRHHSKGYFTSDILNFGDFNRSSFQRIENPIESIDFDEAFSLTIDQPMDFGYNAFDNLM